jgi:aspartyl-tRNA synthetase
MIKIDYISDILKEPNRKVHIGGRVSRINDLKSARFIWVKDVSGAIQVTVIKKKTSPELLTTLESLMPNDFVAINGHIPEEVKAASGLEIIPDSVRIVSKAMGPSPIDIDGYNETSVDKRLDWRALDLRNSRSTAVFLIQSKLMEGMQKHLYSEKFMQVFTPSLMGVSSEGGSEVFNLKHFGKNAFLRQDPQLHRELLMVAGFEKIYEIGPSWRAELSNTPQHLTEHRTCAAEISFIDDEHDIIKVEENLIVHGLSAVVKDCQEELKALGVELNVPKLPFPVLEFPKVYEILEELGFKYQRGREDYDKKGEMALGNYVKEKYNSDFFFVNRFPFAVKPFYVMKVDEDPTWARSVDLIYKGMELSSGGQREHRYEKIISQAKEKGLDIENLEWFTNFFKYGAPPHGGFSIGMERFVMQILNLQNIREASLFPRAPERLVP